MHVVVIGAGLLGVSSAYYLRRHGVDVTVLDSESGPALGASYGNGGYVQASVADPWNAPGAFGLFARAWMAGLGRNSDSSAFIARTKALPGLFGWGLRFLRSANAATYLHHTHLNSHLARYSLKSLAEIETDEQIQYSQSDTGGLIIFRDAQSFEAYRKLAEQVCGEEVACEFLDRGALMRKEPSLQGIEDNLVGAVHFADDYSGNSREFCEQLAAATANRGAEFVFNADVTDIKAIASGVQVSTGAAEYRADAVLIAAGVRSKKLAKSLGIDLPIAPAKGYSISIPMREWSNRPRHMIADMGVHAGVNPLGDVLRVAGTAEFAGMQTGVSPERVDYLLSLTRQIFPEFAETVDRKEIEAWAGHRPLSCDGLPMIGSTSVRNVYVNTGHGGLGWTQATGSGKALADHIAGITGAFDLSDFSLGRFSK